MHRLTVAIQKWTRIKIWLPGAAQGALQTSWLCMASNGAFKALHALKQISEVLQFAVHPDPGAQAPQVVPDRDEKQGCDTRPALFRYFRRLVRNAAQTSQLFRKQFAREVVLEGMQPSPWAPRTGPPYGLGSQLRGPARDNCWAI